MSVDLGLEGVPSHAWQAMFCGVLTGVLNSRRVALGSKVDWAYAPAEVKVLTSSDGANFDEARCWQSSTRVEVAFEESFMIDAPRRVKAVSGRRRWSLCLPLPPGAGHLGVVRGTDE